MAVLHEESVRVRYIKEGARNLPTQRSHPTEGHVNARVYDEGARQNQYNAESDFARIGLGFVLFQRQGKVQIILNAFVLKRIIERLCRCVVALGDEFYGYGAC